MKKTEYVDRLLEEIRIKPAMYLGKKSLETLSIFVTGYECAVDEITGSQDAGLFCRMQEFVQDKYNIPMTSRNWAQLISERTASPEAAFDLFFELYDEMKQAGWLSLSHSELDEAHDRRMEAAGFRVVRKYDNAAEYEKAE